MSDGAAAPLYELHSRPTLDSPVLVVALEGWIDAGLGAAAAAQALVADLHPTALRRSTPTGCSTTAPGAP